MDTLSYTNRLIGAGFTRPQSETQAQLFNEVLMTEVATKKDLDSTRAALKADIDNLRVVLKADVNNLRTELKADINNLRSEFKTDINNLRVELKAEIHNLRSEFNELKFEISNIKTEIKEIKNLLQDRPGHDLYKVMKINGLVIGFIFAAAGLLPFVFKFYSWVADSLF